MCKAIDKNIVCCLPAYPRKLAFWLLLSELILGRFFQIFFTLVKGGRVRLRCTLGKCQCRGVLLFFFIIVGRTVLAVGAGGVVPLFLSLHID